jgi:predicted acyltransferase
MLGMMASDFAFKEGGIPFLLHADWSGVTVVDFVFPAFMFIMGSAIPLAIN